MSQADKPKVQVDIREFLGIELQSDAFDLEPGKAMDQVNFKSDQVGAMAVRWGFLPCSFDASSWS